MDQPQARRIAQNEARFRDMNERLRTSVEAFRGDADGDIAIMCECGITQCTDMVQLPLRAYAGVREHPRRFIIKPEHVVGSPENPVEAAVQREQQYWVVEKLGYSAKVAESEA